IRQELPERFQTAEFLLERGQLDLVCARQELRGRLRQLLYVTRNAPVPVVPVPGLPAAKTIIRDPAALTPRDPWETVRLARDTARPTTLEHIGDIFDSFVELHGDRGAGDCPAIVAGFARLGPLSLAVIGHQKGHTTAELVARNFGMAQPEGY